MQAIIARYLIHCRHCGLAPQTLTGYRNKLALYAAFIARLPHALRLDPESVLAFLAARPCTDVGRAGYWRALRAFHRWAEAAGQLPANPCARLRPRFRPPAPRPIYTLPDLDDLLARLPAATWTQRRDHVYFTTLAYTGARASEILGLRRADLDPARRTLSVLGKGNKPRLVALARLVAARLALWLPEIPGACLFPGLPTRDRPLHLCTASHRWQAAQLAAGVPRPIRLHDLRHSFASAMLEAEEDIAVVSRQLGHSDIRTTQMIYAHVTLRPQLAALDRVFG